VAGWRQVLDDLINMNEKDEHNLVKWADNVPFDHLTILPQAAVPPGIIRRKDSIFL
jgi:hypothetical protein